MVNKGKKNQLLNQDSLQKYKANNLKALKLQINIKAFVFWIVLFNISFIQILLQIYLLFFPAEIYYTKHQMLERSFKWKEINKSPSRLNVIMSNPKKVLPTKFAPSRENSMSVDKLFNDSRSRLHASMEASRVQQSISPPQKDRFNQGRPVLQKTQSMAQKLSSSLKGGPQQQSSYFDQAKNNKNTTLVLQLKKQYIIFKQNVLNQLERQKQMVQKFVKQIVLTMEYEIQKLKNVQKQIKTVVQKQVKSVAEKAQSLHQTSDLAPAKTMDEWKNKLQKAKTITPILNEPVVPTKKLNSSANLQKVSKKTADLLPPQLPLDVSVFLSNFDRLKKQFTQMDKLFINPTLRKTTVNK